MRADALDLLSQVQPARVAAYDLSAQARELLDLAGAQAIQRPGLQALPGADQRAAPGVGGDLVVGHQHRQARPPAAAVELPRQALQRVACGHGDRLRGWFGLRLARRGALVHWRPGAAPARRHLVTAPEARGFAPAAWAGRS